VPGIPSLIPERITDKGKDPWRCWCSARVPSTESTMEDSHCITQFEASADHLVQFLHSGEPLSDEQDKQLKFCIEALRLTYEEWVICQRKAKKATQPA